jgi:hypothetical protein
VRIHLGDRGLDAAIVAGIWVFSGVLNGSEPWVSFDTPDSEFHASMSIYTDQVTDRADQPVYYWTRIGHIAPAHVLTELLGPLPGLEIYRLALLAVIVVSLYATLRHVTGRLNATVLTLLVTSSTVLLGYLGNPYPTAASMAGISALIAVGVLGRDWRAHVLAGAIIGWLVMTSPYGTLLGLIAYLSALAGRELSRPRVRPVLVWACSFTAGALVVFSALWLIGRLLFPGLDWLSTYLYWNSALSQADYIVDRLRWTWDPSLLVPAVAGVIAVAMLLSRPRGVATRTAAALGVATPVFALIYWWLLPNNYLEIPHYQAMLFPAALTAIALAAAARLPDVPVTWTRALVSAAVVGLSILAGHSALDLSVAQARLLAVVLVAVFLVPTGSRWAIAIIAVGLTFAGAQVLQNARDTFGVSTSGMYVNAYVANEAEAMMASAVAAQDWVVDRTSPGDRVLTWVDANWAAGEQDLLPLAAFQLWGANEAARGPTASPEAIASMEARKPLSIVMYGRSVDTVLQFWNSLPKDWRASTPECTQVPWPATGSAAVCITRPVW